MTEDISDDENLGPRLGNPLMGGAATPVRLEANSPDEFLRSSVGSRVGGGGGSSSQPNVNNNNVGMGGGGSGGVGGSSSNNNNNNGASVASGAAGSSKGIRSSSQARERLEPLLSFLEDERVLHPAYGSQQRRALTTADRMEQLRAALDALPLPLSEVEAVMKTVADKLPKGEKSLTLADALAEPSPAKQGGLTKVTPLDAKSEKYVRRWLEKRRHFYRERRTSRVTKLLQDFDVSEEAYLKVLKTLAAFSAELEPLVSSNDLAAVFSDVLRVLEMHSQLSQVVKQATSSEMSTDPITQRAFVLEFVLEPMLPCLRSYGTFFGNHYLRHAAIHRWSRDDNINRVLSELEKKMQTKLTDLFGYVTKRIEGYKGLVERLELLLEEERAPLGSDRRKKDVETSERVQAVCSQLTVQCAHLQVSIKDSLDADLIRSQAAIFNLGADFVSQNPHRKFLRTERVLVMLNKKTLYDDCALLVFNDVLVLVLLATSKINKTGANKVIVTLDVGSVDIEEDYTPAWTEESAPPSTPAVAAEQDAGSSGVRSLMGILKRGEKGSGKKEDQQSNAGPEFSQTPDMGALTAQSCSFGIVVGDNKWQVRCATRATRIAVVDDILNCKYKHRVFGQPISSLAERDGDSVPEIIRLCARELRKRTSEEGVFRIPGRATVIDSIVKAVNSGNRVELSDLSTHDIAGIVRIWLRLLPTSVIPRPLLNDFLQCNRIADPEEKTLAIRALCERKLPSNNVRVLGFILSLLNVFHLNKDACKMDADNLATIFAPSLFFSLNQELSKEEILENAKLGPELKAVIAFMIANVGTVVEDMNATLKMNLMQAADVKK